MDVLCLFAAATFAFPATWRSRVLAVAAASLVMFGVNVSRIVVLYFIGIYAPARFELFHMQIFPLVIVIVATGGFLGWTRAASGRAGGAHAVVPT